MKSKLPDVNTVALRKFLDEGDAMAIVDQKKTDPFQSFLSRINKDDIVVDSLKLHYECILTLYILRSGVCVGTKKCDIL